MNVQLFLISFSITCLFLLGTLLFNRSTLQVKLGFDAQTNQSEISVLQFKSTVISVGWLTV